MRSLLLLAPALLVACAAVPPPPPPGPAPIGGTCDAAGGQAFIGQIASAATGTAILVATHSNVLRWAAPGTMMTMEYRADRVTVRYDSAMRITAVNCG